MRKTTFGKSGLQVSTLGFGCMRFPLIGNDNSRIDEEQAMEMIHHAIDNGINYFDTAYPYHGMDFSKGGASEPFLAKALKNGYREKVLLATKLPSWVAESDNPGSACIFSEKPILERFRPASGRDKCMITAVNPASS